MQYKIIVDKQPSSNPSDEKKEYIIDIEELRVKGNVYDSLNIEMDRTYVTRRLSLSEYGVLSVLDEPVIQELTDLDIKLFEGDNYIYLMDMQGNKFYAEYIVKNDFTDLYVTTNQMNSSIEQTAQSIELSVNQKLEGYSTTQEMNSAIEQTAQSITSSVNQTLTNYATNNDLEDEVTELNSTITQTASEINLEVSKKVGDDEIISCINQSAETIQIDANKISLEGKEINLTGDNITVSSNNLEIDNSGNITIKGTEQAAAFKVIDNEHTITIAPTRVLLRYNGSIAAWLAMDSEGKGSLQMPNDAHANFWGTGSGTTIDSQGITTPRLTQTSLKSIKKNISKFTKNATDIINNSDIYEYNLKSDADTDKKMIGFVIGNNYKTPNEVIDKNGQAVSLYSAIGILWKAVQELSARVEQLEKEVQHE